MINLVRRVRINDRIPAMWYNDKLIRTAYRKETLIVGEYQYDPDPTPYATKYFCIESLEDSNTITFTKGTSAPNNTYYTSTDLNTWTEYYGTQSWTLNNGQKLYFKAVATFWGYYTDYVWKFSSTGRFNVSGNIMSLLYGDNFAGQTLLKAYYETQSRNYTYCGFCNLFRNCTNLIDASKLVLPATEFQTTYFGEGVSTHYGCYSGMFYGCTSLLKGPKQLPATSLRAGCYDSMFYGCTSLETAIEELPASKLEYSCYQYMFNGCTNLIKAPIILAQTTSHQSMLEMFKNCSNLTEIKCAVKTFNGNLPLYNWVSGVSATGDFYGYDRLNWPTGNSGIPTGWTWYNFS